MDSDNNIPFLIGHGHERLVTENTGIGNENMYATEFVNGSFYDLFAILCRAYS